MKYFTLDEFKCSHCHIEKMDKGFLTRLDALRAVYNKPIIISSGYRCPEYNGQISKTGLNGPHTTGKAVDIKIYGEDAYELLGAAYSFGKYFKGIGIKQKGPYESRFIHLDALDIPGRPWIWSY